MLSSAATALRSSAGTGRREVSLTLADARTRSSIYAMRHEVYAEELGQHAANDSLLLTDALDAVNVYPVARVGGEIAGFVSITPPTGAGYSIDRYFARAEVPLVFDDRLFEVRLLTVQRRWRTSRVAALLMYAAWRYVKSVGGRTIVGIGRLEVLDMYRRVGLEPLGIRTKSGNVTFELRSGDLRGHPERLQHVAGLLEPYVEWDVPGVSFQPVDGCYHGGAFFEAIGDEFDALQAREQVINADVLDAWFDPAPSVTRALSEHLPWILRTSPPSGCDGMRRILARTRGLHEENVLPGAGSSDLIFLGLRHWVQPRSRVLILDPMYGEYAHVLERVIGCRVERLTLSRANAYAVEDGALARRLERGYDWVVLVNPNSPTGQHVPRERLEALVRSAPAGTRFWIDETYVEYAGPDQSLEHFAAASENVVICKSMSKVYALSGARVAYLCGPVSLMAELRAITPPWAVGLPGQVAACEALRSVAYYQERWEQTHRLRAELSEGLRALGWDIVPGCANFVLCHLPSAQPEASVVVAACRARGLFIRDVASMGACFDRRTVRVAVKDAVTNVAALAILRATLRDLGQDGLIEQRKF